MRAIALCPQQWADPKLILRIIVTLRLEIWMNNKQLSNRNLKQGLGFFTAAIDAALIYSFSQDLSDVKLFILRLLLTIFISAGIWLIICYVIDRVDGAA